MNDRRNKGDRRAVEGPRHYGGADDPFETIKVLEAKLTPQEFVGFLKGNAIKYLDRHPHKDGQTDLMKSKWYHDRLVEFCAGTGHDVIYPQTVYWTEAFPEPGADLDDMIKQTCGHESGVFMLNQNTAPYIHWVFTYHVGDGDGGSDLDWTIYEDESHARMAMQTFHDAEDEKDRPVTLPDPCKDGDRPSTFEKTKEFVIESDYDAALACNTPMDRTRLANHHAELAERKGQPSAADVAAERGHFATVARNMELAGDTKNAEAIKDDLPGHDGEGPIGSPARVSLTAPGAAGEAPAESMRRVEGGE